MTIVTIAVNKCFVLCLFVCVVYLFLFILFFGRVGGGGWGGGLWSVSFNFDLLRITVFFFF